MAEPSAFIEPTLLPDGLAGVAADATTHPERALKVVDLYKAAIGPRQQAYYLNQFSSQEAGPGLRFSWHWAAFFSALNWFIFRKMWAWAGRYAALLAALMGVAVLGADAWGLARLEALALGAAVWAGVSVLAGVLANALYHRHCMALIHGVLVSGADRETAADLLADQACSNRRFSGQVVVNVALLLFLPALATFAPWNGRDAWEWLTEAPVEQVAPEPLAPVAPATDVAEGERRVLPPGTATPTLKITSAEPGVPLPAPAKVLEAPPEVPPSVPPVPSGPVVEVAPAEPVPVAVLPAAPVSEARASAQAGLVLPGEPVPVKAEPALVAKPAVKEVPKPTAGVLRSPVEKPVQAASASGFGVQVGIFAQPANVANVLTQLKAQGLPVYTDAITLVGQPRTRVRVGPYAGRDEAQRVAGQIADVGLPAVVVPLPTPGAAAPRR